MKHSSAGQLAGLYIHIPFCLNKCRYCDFYSITDVSLRSRFLEALFREMQLMDPIGLAFDTLYVGGGTPSVLEADSIGEIIATSSQYFNFASDTEVTLEVNPATVTPDILRAYRVSGINRLNIGAQSFNDKNLGFLGRIHSADEARLTFEWARQAGFDNIGLDLIFGLPGQDEKNWLDDLTAATAMGPEHLSCYMLTCEPETPLDLDVKSGRVRLAADAAVLELFDTAIDFLTQRGFLHYEISNFARRHGSGNQAKTSRHNQKYWSYAPYIGLGPSAHSFIEPQRWWNHRSLTTYLKQIETGESAIADRERLTREQMMMETIYLGFRTAAGLALEAFRDRFGIDFLKTFEETVADFQSEGLVEVAGARCRLTQKGMALIDGITAAFVDLV